MICFILVALFVLFFVWGGAFIEGRHSFENTYFKGALIRGGRSLQNIYFKGGAHSRGALFRGNTVSACSDYYGRNWHIFLVRNGNKSFF